MIKVTRRSAAAAAAAVALGTGLAVSAAASPAARAITPSPANKASTVNQPNTANQANTATTAYIPRCSPSQLAVWVNADSADGAAGTIYYHLDYTNISGTPCHLYSWPGVSAVNSRGRQLGAAAVRTGGAPATYVNIPPGGTAHSVFGYVDVQVSKACKPVTATYLKVYPPNDSAARHAYFPLPVCTNKTQDMVVWRVQPGA